ncbi:MAG: nuclear transport factor 2 family protein [Janthinobacterium lividum]
MSDEFQVQQVLARYVRAADARDGIAMGKLFMPDGRVDIGYSNGGIVTAIGQLQGSDAIAQAVSSMMRPHPPRGWSHHTTHDLLIEVDGDRATLDAQFVVFNTVGAEKPADGWSKDALFALQGTVTPIESGYYRPVLRRLDGQWRIETLQILHDLPMAMPDDTGT